MPVVAAKLALEKKSLSSLFSEPGKRDLVICLVLSAFTLLIYNNVTHYDFINFDDDQYVTNNRHVQAGLSWQTVQWAFRSTDAGNWHPVTWLSHALDFQLFHMNPAGHHYVNVLLHATNVILIFLLLNWATGFVWRSATVAALFAVHPLNVESVAWVAERKNVLCTLFFLLALAAYGWYVRRPGIVRYLAIAGLFALGLMSKPMVITLPFVLLLLDYWPLGRLHFGTAGPTEGSVASSPRSFRYLCLEKLPLLALSIASSVITMWAQQSGGAMRSWAEAPFFSRLENAVVSYLRYLGKAIWPTHLAPMYPYRAALPAWEIITSLAFLLIVTRCVIANRQRRYLAVGWFFFVGTLIPVIGLVQVGNQAMSDRYAYIPLIGLLVALVWLFADAARNRNIPVRSLVPATQVVIAILALVTYAQHSYWQESVSLWSHALDVTSRNFVAEDNLGDALVTADRDEEAIGHFRAASEIHPSDPVAELNIGFYEKRHGNLTAAIARYETVLRVTPAPRMRLFAFANLGTAYRILGDYPRATYYYRAALQIDKEATLPRIGLGLLALKTGNPSEAAAYFYDVTKLDGSDVPYLLLARALADSGHPDQAVAAFEQAKHASQNLTKAQQTAGRLLSE